MKKIFLLGLIIIMFSSCALNKTPTNPEDFSRVLSELGYKITNITDEYKGGANVVLLAVDPEEKQHIEFYEFTTQAQAKNVFSNNNSNQRQVGSGSSSSASASGNNWAYISKSAGELYGFVSYIDNTLVFARAPVKQRKTVKDALKKIGY